MRKSLLLLGIICLVAANAAAPPRFSSSPFSSSYSDDDADDDDDSDSRGLQIMITQRMRRTLEDELGYLQDEVDCMEPSIAAVVIERSLSRPSNGMPVSWQRQLSSRGSNRNIIFRFASTIARAVTAIFHGASTAAIKLLPLALTVVAIGSGYQVMKENKAALRAGAAIGSSISTIGSTVSSIAPAKVMAMSEPRPQTPTTSGISPSSSSSSTKKARPTRSFPKSATFKAPFRLPFVGKRLNLVSIPTSSANLNQSKRAPPNKLNTVASSPLSWRRSIPFLKKSPPAPSPRALPLKPTGNSVTKLSQPAYRTPPSPPQPTKHSSSEPSSPLSHPRPSSSIPSNPAPIPDKPVDLAALEQVQQLSPYEMLRMKIYRWRLGRSSGSD